MNIQPTFDLDHKFPYVPDGLVPVIPVKKKIYLYDNTRISSFRGCQRKYYFRHIRHWTSDKPAIAPAFGSGWHAGMDTLWRGGLIEEAVEAWNISMVDEGININPITGFDNFRSEGTVRSMFDEYMKKYSSFFNDIELLEVEMPFAVPLPIDNCYYVGRIDKVFRRKSTGLIEYMDHKTASEYRKVGFFSPLFVNSFSPNSQFDGYLFAGHLIHGDEFSGIVSADAALVHKTVHNGFMRIPIKRSIDMLDNWIFRTTHTINAIREETINLKEKNVKSHILPCFPGDDNRCRDFFKECLYRGVCRFQPNPNLLQDPPQGLSVNKWEPFNEDIIRKVIK